MRQSLRVFSAKDTEAISRIFYFTAKLKAKQNDSSRFLKRPLFEAYLSRRKDRFGQPQDNPQALDGQTEYQSFCCSPFWIEK